MTIGSIAVVTGGGTGIGAALTLNLAHHLPVLCVGRRMECLNDVVLKSNINGCRYRVYPCQADVSTVEGRATISDAVATLASPPPSIQFLVHNAAIIGDIAPIMSVTEDLFEKTMRINVHAPLFLTKSLVSSFTPASRILMISSGAAHRPILDWTEYCTSKSALYALTRLLQAESIREGSPLFNVAIGSVRPGIVDTSMQSSLRDSDFPDKQTFINLKLNNQLLSSETVASFLLYLLRECPREGYVSASESDMEHDIRTTTLPWRHTVQ